MTYEVVSKTLGTGRSVADAAELAANPGLAETVEMGAIWSVRGNINGIAGRNFMHIPPEEATVRSLTADSVIVIDCANLAGAQWHRLNLGGKVGEQLFDFSVTNLVLDAGDTAVLKFSHANLLNGKTYSIQFPVKHHGIDYDDTVVCVTDGEIQFAVRNTTNSSISLADDVTASVIAGGAQ